jgi:hypothetical protein
MTRIPTPKRSACGLQFGLCAGIFTHSTPRSRRMVSNASVTSESRSWIRYLASRRNPSTRSVRFRAICFIQSPLGFTPIPAISTARLLRAMTKKTMWRTVPRRPRTSTLKKSHAYSVSQWALMNCFHVRFFSRSGAGSMPAAANISATAVRPISIASPVRSASLSLV